MAKKNIGELLVRESLINIDQLEQARREQKKYGGRLLSSLVRLGYVDDHQIADFLGKQFKLPTIDLSQFDIDPSVVKMVPHQVCQKHRVMPVQKVDRTLVVAFADPSNIYVKDDLSLLTRCKIEPVVASEASIMAAIEKHYGGGSDRLTSLSSAIEEETDSFQDTKQQAEIVDKADSKADPIISFVNTMLAEAIKSRASDIHIESYEKRFRIRFRIDGVLFEKIQPPPGAAGAIVSRIKVVSKMDIAERRKPQDGRLKVKLQSGAEVDFRVSTLPTLFGEKVVLRILDKSNLQVDLERVGFSETNLRIFKESLHQPQGMILVTGPTGSGKTTTLYSALGELNNPTKNISTAEDPVEFNLDGINQVHVNAEIGFTFATALRAFLRQDPDVIMVGEIRDLETAEVAYKAASTGHMVVSTLHTNDAPSTVTRLLDMGLPPYVVAEATTLVLAQRLIKKICPRCITEDRVSEKVLLDLGVKPEQLPEFKEIKKGEGCSTCNGTGLAGRTPIFEIMRMTPTVKESIFKGVSPTELKRYAIEKDGMETLRFSALAKLKQGITSIQEVINSSVGDNV